MPDGAGDGSWLPYLWDVLQPYLSWGSLGAFAVAAGKAVEWLPDFLKKWRDGQRQKRLDTEDESLKERKQYSEEQIAIREGWRQSNADLIAENGRLRTELREARTELLQTRQERDHWADLARGWRGFVLGLIQEYIRRMRHDIRGLQQIIMALCERHGDPIPELVPPPDDPPVPGVEELPL